MIILMPSHLEAWPRTSKEIEIIQENWKYSDYSRAKLNMHHVQLYILQKVMMKMFFCWDTECSR